MVLLQTCALVMVSTFGFSLGPFYQTIVTAAVLAWIAIALLAVRPYKCPAAGRVAVIGVCVLFFTAYACLTFIPYNNAGPGAVYMHTPVCRWAAGFCACSNWLGPPASASHSPALAHPGRCATAYTPGGWGA